MHSSCVYFTAFGLNIETFTEIDGLLEASVVINDLSRHFGDGVTCIHRFRSPIGWFFGSDEGETAWTVDFKDCSGAFYDVQSKTNTKPNVSELLESKNEPRGV